jgi:hypothetical protein
MTKQPPNDLNLTIATIIDGTFPREETHCTTKRKIQDPKTHLKTDLGSDMVDDPPTKNYH